MVSNKGKFSERLKKIVFLKRNKISKNVDSDIQLEDTNKIYINFLKIIAAIPGLVYGSINEDEKSKKKNAVDVNFDVMDSNNENNNNKNYNNSEIDIKEYTKKKDVFLVTSHKTTNRVAKRKRINDISIPEIMNKQEEYYKKNYIGINYEKNKTDIDNKSKRVKELEKSIINLIKKDLIKIVNEMEILQSELYILSEVNGETKVLRDCRRELDQVKSMLCKIDKLKEKYDFLKDNYDFEYLLEIDNNDLVDKIIELKDTFGNNELKAVSEDYKLLEVYKYLYQKIDDLQEKTVLYEDKKKEEVAKLKERDIDFEKLKQEVYNVDGVNKNYESFINNQNDLLREIDAKVSKINSYEQINYRLKGFGELFRSSFKYFGLLMVSPLKGVIPSIATETLITGNLIKNLYKNLEWEETKNVVYEAIDYSNMISNAIIDLESTSNIVDMTLDDIVHLKMKYNDEFKKYHGDFLEYREIMHKINDMENKILGNKIKIEVMRKRALEQQKANDKKLRLVRELNEKKQ